MIRKVGRQRQDWVHQVSSSIVRGNSLIATEKLNIKGMTHQAKKGSKRKAQKTGLNRHMLDVGMLKSAIDYKVHEAGGSYRDTHSKKRKKHSLFDGNLETPSSRSRVGVVHSPPL